VEQQNPPDLLDRVRMIEFAAMPGAIGSAASAWMKSLDGLIG
jgi:hypothetical protein